MFASERYLAVHGLPTLDTIERHHAIAVGASTEWALRDRRVTPQVRLLASSHAVAKRAALAGLGIARFAASYAEHELETGALHLVLPEQSTKATIYAVMPGTGSLAPKTRAFLDLVLKRVTNEQLCPATLRPYL